MRVFGYGSLTMPESVAVTLNRPVGRDAMIPAELSGWRRSWNVGSDRNSHPERTIYNPDGSVFDGVMAALGLVRETADVQCNGAVFSVSREDLARLDVRERNYHRIDVSHLVTYDGKPDDCTVFVYVPRAEAVERLEHALKTPALRPAAIRRSYLEQTRAGFSLLGEPELHRFDAAPMPDIEIRDLRLESGPAGASPGRRSTGQALRAGETGRATRTGSGEVG
jgi:cation transport regulator ChaC